MTTWKAEELSGRLEVSLEVVSRKRIEVVFKCKKGKQLNPFPTTKNQNKIKVKSFKKRITYRGYLQTLPGQRRKFGFLKKLLFLTKTYDKGSTPLALATGPQNLRVHDAD